MIFSPGYLSRVPSKIRCCSAIVVSSGLPMVFASQPLPLKRAARGGVLCGWMNSTAPSSSALAQTGWNRSLEKSSPSTLPPIAAPFSPCFLIAVSSCCTARSGYCRLREAKAAKRSGRAAQSSASFSLLSSTILAAVSRSLPYQNGLIDSTSMSIAMASMPLRRVSIAMKCSCAPLVGGITLRACSPISAIDSWNRQCACTSMVLTRLPLTLTGSRRPPFCAFAKSSIPQLQNTIPAAAARLRKPRRVVMPVTPAQACVDRWMIRGLTPPCSVSLRRALQPLNTDRFDELRPARDVVFDECPKAVGIERRRRLHAGCDQPLLRFQTLYRAQDLGVQLLDNVLARTGGRKQAAPARHVERRIAGLDHRRQRRQQDGALRGADGKTA